MTKETLPPPHAIRLAHNFTRVYGSQVTVISTTWDLSFSIAQPIAETPEEAYLEQRALVTMSWQTAKSFAQILQNAIAVYEQEFGEIRLTPRS